jgi:hypothetical protein
MRLREYQNALPLARSKARLDVLKTSCLASATMCLLLGVLLSSILLPFVATDVAERTRWAAAIALLFCVTIQVCSPLISMKTIIFKPFA